MTTSIFASPLDPISATLLGLVFPLFLHISVACMLSKSLPKSIGDAFSRTSDLLTKKPVYFFSSNIIIAGCNQALFAFSTLLVGSDISYYLKVDLSSYDAWDALNVASSTTSFNSYLSSIQYATMPSHRFLQTSSGNTFSIIYHLSDWGNLLNEDTMTRICETEMSIKANCPCLNLLSFSSVIPTTFDPITCQSTGDLQSTYTTFNSVEISEYFDDSFRISNIRSAVVISYAKAGSCESQSATGMTAQLNSNALQGIQISYAESNLLQKAFLDAIINALYLSVVGLIVFTGIFIFGICGVLVTLCTLFCLVISLLCAAGCLPAWGYSSISAFNVMCVFILVGVGANSVLLFGSALSRVVTSPLGHITPEEFRSAYSQMGEAALFTVLAAALSLFSKLASPVIVISQLGAFMGTAVVVFYAQFHYLIIPLWIITCRFNLTKGFNGYHSHLDSQRACNVASCAGGGAGSGSVATANNALISNCDEVNRMANPSNDFNDVHSHHRSLKVTNTTSDQPNSPHLSPTSDPSTIKDEVGWMEGHQSLVSALSLQWWGVVSLCGSLALLAAAAYIAASNCVIDFGIPQLVEPSSNLGQCLTIVKSYKGSLFSAPKIDSSLGGGTYPPSFAPTVGTLTISPTPNPTPPVPTPYPTTPMPTAVSTTLPTDASYAPTPIPVPFTLPPESPPTSFPTSSNIPNATSDTHASSVSYTVQGCWGISYSKKYKDSTVEPNYNYASFFAYSNTGLLQDIASLCSYVGSNREFLNIDKSWVRETDCLYDQLLPLMNSIGVAKSSPLYVSALLLLWARSSPTSGQLLGVQPVEVNNTNTLAPAWLCANFSVTTPVASLIAQPSVAQDMLLRWQQAYDNHGGVSANAQGINVLVDSEAFTLPLLAAEVVLSIELAGIISISGFVGLLLVFTFDVRTILLGTLVMTLTLVATVCLHIFISTPIVDLLDIVVLIAIVGMIVDFPIHAIMHYKQSCRGTHAPSPTQQIIHNRNNDKFYSEDTSLIAANDAESNPADHALVAELDDTHDDSQLLKDAPMNPSDWSHVSSTSWTMSKILFLPMVASVGIAVPLLYADLQLLKKTGEYIVIMTIFSYIATCAILPLLLSLTDPRADRLTQCCNLSKYCWLGRPSSVNESSSRSSKDSSNCSATADALGGSRDVEDFNNDDNRAAADNARNFGDSDPMSANAVIQPLLDEDRHDAMSNQLHQINCL